MSSRHPQVIVRLGSHAEKEYLLKLRAALDGVIVGANLIEASPGATASLLVRMGGNDRSLFVDPMTYAFGTYVDPTGSLREDLDWIKSEQIERDAPKRKGEKRTKRYVRRIKRSYLSLAAEFGEPIESAVGDGKNTSRAIGPSSFAGALASSFARRVIDYQLRRTRGVFERDAELKEYAEDIPTPEAVSAPYFYLEPSERAAWLDLNLRLMRAAASLDDVGTPVHGILCADRACLKDASFLADARAGVAATGVSAIWIWFSRFLEDRATELELRAYGSFVSALSEDVTVYSLHGGFFSLALRDFGMRGVSHGVGYGEQKDVHPVIGQSIPTVRYYLPSLARKVSVPDVELAFEAMEVRMPSDFHERVCQCAVCRGVVVKDLKEFGAYGEMHLSRPDAQRKTQTPAAAKLCRYHFLLNRLRERDELQTLPLRAIIQNLEAADMGWGAQPSLHGEASHIARWKGALIDLASSRP